MARSALIVARADVAADFRNALEALHETAQGRISATPYRMSTDAPGVATYYVSHGHMENRVWNSVVAALNTSTQGVRDSVDWQGKPSTAVTDARWGIAYEGSDIVAGFRVTRHGKTRYADPTEVLAALGLVPIAADDTP